MLRLTLAVVAQDGALPASFLSAAQFAEMGDDVLTWAGGGANTFDEREVDVRLTVLGPAVASEEHPCLLNPAWRREHGNSKRVGFHYNAKTRFPLPKNQGFRSK